MLCQGWHLVMHYVIIVPRFFLPLGNVLVTVSSLVLWIRKNCSVIHIGFVDLEQYMWYLWTLFQLPQILTYKTNVTDLIKLLENSRKQLQNMLLLLCLSLLSSSMNTSNNLGNRLAAATQLTFKIIAHELFYSNLTY